MQKEWWETVVFFYRSVILLTFFNQIADFGENMWFVVAMATVAETTAAAVVRQQQLQQLLLS